MVIEDMDLKPVLIPHHKGRKRLHLGKNQTYFIWIILIIYSFDALEYCKTLTDIMISDSIFFLNIRGDSTQPHKLVIHNFVQK